MPFLLLAQKNASNSQCKYWSHTNCGVLAFKSSETSFIFWLDFRTRLKYWIMFTFDSSFYLFSCKSLWALVNWQSKGTTDLWHQSQSHTINRKRVKKIKRRGNNCRHQNVCNYNELIADPWLNKNKTKHSLFSAHYSLVEFEHSRWNSFGRIVISGVINSLYSVLS